MTDPQPVPATPSNTGLSDFVASQVRTVVPLVVGAIAGWASGLGIALPDDARDALASLIGFAAGAAWYVAVRSLEQKWPKLGWLLGVPVQPRYGDVPVESAITLPEQAEAVATETAPDPALPVPPSAE